MHEVPFLDLRGLYSTHRQELDAAIAKVLDNAAYIGGRAVAEFEQSFAAFLGPDFHVTGCGNGTDAIHLAARGLKLPAGAEVIAPAMTFVATLEALLAAGLSVRLADVTPDTWTLDPEAVKTALTPRTKLIVPVHLYGQMADMTALTGIAEARGCRVLEDAAQAHGATWEGKPPGFHGDIAAFSMYPGKNLGAFGDAGAIASRSAELVKFCHALGHHGGVNKYEHLYRGMNSRLDGIQAAVLGVKLKYLSQWNEARRRVAAAYLDALGGIAGLTLPTVHAKAQHVFHLFVVQVEERERFIASLSAAGIETGIHYPKAIHQLPVFQSEPFAVEKFPNAERLAAHGVSLPMCPTMSTDRIKRVIDAVRKYFGR